ncbi:hypothetical protein ARNL5_01130 [Anaerolineae bacterium]|nr:hypothetical protein ARNL5_01130 [Anaerolineae bacterium]
MTTDYAPIVISVYDRLEHLRACLDSLRNSDLSRQSDLHIVSDAAHITAHEDRIAQVRNYIGQITGFRRIVPVFRDKNLGSFQSTKNAFDEILEQYGKLIFLEDDNVVAPNFLRFLNDGLTFYQNDPRVFSISGYNYPVNIPASYRHDVYLWQGFTAWGVGLWADRWREVTWSYAGVEQLTGRRKRELDRISEHLYRHLAYYAAQNKLIIDVIVSYHLFRHQKYSIFPVLSKVRNIGTDGTGEHSRISDRYTKQALDPGLPYQLISNLLPDEQINRILWQHFRTPPRAKAKMTLARLIPGRQKAWLKSHRHFWQGPEAH